MNSLERHLEINALLEYYRPLLTEKQASMMRYYYEENYSLSEIADYVGTSRTAVHEHIRNTVDKLYDYESKLKLHEKAQKRRDILDALKRKDDEEIIALVRKLEEVE